MASEILRRRKQSPWVLSPARPETTTVQRSASKEEKRFRGRGRDAERRVSTERKTGLNRPDVETTRLIRDEHGWLLLAGREWFFESMRLATVPGSTANEAAAWAIAHRSQQCE